MARSSAKADFRALAQGIYEGMWIKGVLSELKIPSNGQMEVFCDNMATISIAKNPVHHDRTKHVELDRHFIKEKIEDGLLSLVYTTSDLQVIDVLTKALPRVKFEELVTKLGMIDIYSSLEEECGIPERFSLGLGVYFTDFILIFF